MISKEKLEELYVGNKKSAFEVAKFLGCSESNVNYWLKFYNVPKRTISEAIYTKWNPDGDPFEVNNPKNLKEYELYGLGLGLYWGEGTKADKHSIRLSNSDPKLINIFIHFLYVFFSINKSDLKFYLHTFSDLDVDECINYWANELSIKKEQFYKPYTTITGKLGNYRNKSKYGVLTLNYTNVKLRKILGDLLEKSKCLPM